MDRFFALDLPGCGVRNAETSPSSIAEMVECYRNQLQQQGIPTPYKILAVSMGAMVSAAWSQKYPQEIAAQVLINTSMRPFSPFYQRLRLSKVASVLLLLLGRRSERAWEEFIWRTTCNTSDASILADWIRYRCELPVRTGNAIRQLLAAARYQASPHPPSVPTLILASAQDHLVDTQCSKTLARRWNAPLAVHPTAGHDLPQDDGMWLLQQVTQWLQSGFNPPGHPVHSRDH